MPLNQIKYSNLKKMKHLMLELPFVRKICREWFVIHLSELKIKIKRILRKVKTKDSIPSLKKLLYVLRLNDRLNL